MRMNVQCCQLFIGDFDSFLVGRGHQISPHAQSGLRGGIGNVLLYQFERAQGAASPRFADLTEQPMFNRVPFRRARRIMAHRNRQAQRISDLDLQLLFPNPRAGAVTAAAVRLNQYVCRLRIPLAQFCLAPMRQIVHGKGRRISRLANVDGATVIPQVVDPIGNGPPDRIMRKIVRINLLRCLAPDLARVFEVADQFLFLGIHTDDRLVRLVVLPALHLDVPKLLIALGMICTGRLFDVGAQTVAVGTQDSTDDRLTDPMPLSIQPLAQITQATVEPFLIAHRVARRVRRHKRENHRFEGRIFFSATGRPAPSRRWRLGGTSDNPAASSRRPRRMVLRARPVMRASW